MTLQKRLTEMLENLLDRTLSGKWLAPLAIALLGMVVYVPGEFFVSWDLSKYLVYAQNFSEGRGWVDAAGNSVPIRHGYILLLSAVHALFGPSLKAVAVFEATGATSLLVMVFLLGRRLFGGRVGAVAAGLMLLSPDLIYWLPRHLDPFWPALLLASLLLLLARQRSYWGDWALGLAAGLLLGWALLIKSMAVWFIPAPLLMRLWGCLPGGRSRLFGLYLAGLGVWATDVLLSQVQPESSGSLGTLGNHLHALAGVMQTRDLAGVGRLVRFALEGLWSYFAPFSVRTGLYRALPLLPLMLASMVWVGWRAVKGSQPDRILLVLTVLYLPFAALAGGWEMRPAQILLLVAILYIALAMAIAETCRLAGARLPAIFGAKRGVGLILLTTAILTTYQVALSRKPLGQTFDKNLAWRKLVQDKPFQAKIRGKEIVKILGPEIGQADGVLFGSIPHLNGAHWLSNGKIRGVLLPVKQLTDTIGFPELPLLEIPPATPALAGLLVNRASAIRKNMAAIILSEESFIETVIAKNVRYIAVTRRGVDRVLLSWVKAHPGVFLVRSRGKKEEQIQLFRIEDYRLDPSYSKRRLHISELLIAYLELLQKNYPGRFRWYRRELLENTLGLSPGEIRRLLARRPSPRYVIVP